MPMPKIVLCVLFAFAACSNGAREAPDPVATETPAATTAARQSEECADRTPPAPKKEDDVGKTKPKIEVPDGPPPCDLVIQDIKEGTGAEAEKDATVTIQYVGVSWSNGEEFDSSWSRNQPATFPLGNLIPGWQEGIPGMKEGGRRQLIIPPDLAYGPQPDPRSGIAPNETLIFVIDLIKADAE
jgi:peptidylprolyl isomerase